MSTSLERILVIQDRDRKINRMRRELEDIPARQAHIEEVLTDQKKALEQAQEELKQIQLRLKENEGEVETRNEKVVKYRNQQMQVKNNDEYRALNNEIFTEESAVKELEEAQMQLMEELEAQKTVVSEREAALEKEKEGIAEDIQQLQERAANVKERLDAMEADRAKQAEDVSDEWLSAYERIMKNKGDSAVVAIQGKTCTGCFMNVTPQTVHHARNLETVTSCEYCGRLVYLMDG